MKDEPTPGWNIFKQIFDDHWDGFKRLHPRYDHAYYDTLVQKMLGCGNPEQMGYIEYRCLECGQGKHLVAMSCKSALCLRCSLPDTFWSHKDNVKLNWNGQILVQKVRKKSKTQLEETEITSLGAMNHLGPIFLLTQRSQIDDPNIGKATRNQ